MFNTGESMLVCAPGGLFDGASGDEILFYVLVRGVRGAGRRPPDYAPAGEILKF